MSLSKEEKEVQFKTRILGLKGTVLDDLFKISDGEPLGIGGYGAVLEAIRLRDKKPVAVKMELEANGVLQHEAKVLKLLQGSRHVPELFFTAFGIREDAFIVISLEGRSLQDLLFENGIQRQMSWAVTLATILEICKALEALHSRGIVHRDLSLRNCILSMTPGKSQLVLIDYGLSSIADCGTWQSAPDTDTCKLPRMYYGSYLIGWDKVGTYCEYDDFYPVTYMAMVLRMSPIACDDSEDLEDMKSNLHTNLEATLPTSEKRLFPWIKYLYDSPRFDERERSIEPNHKAIQKLVKDTQGFVAGTIITMDGQPAQATCHRFDSRSGKLSP